MRGLRRKFSRSLDVTDTCNTSPSRWITSGTSLPAGPNDQTLRKKPARLAGKAVASVQLLGSGATLDWRLEDDAMVIKTPENLPSSPATGLKIAFAK